VVALTIAVVGAVPLVRSRLNQFPPLAVPTAAVQESLPPPLFVTASDWGEGVVPAMAVKVRLVGVRNSAGEAGAVTPMPTAFEMAGRLLIGIPVSASVPVTDPVKSRMPGLVAVNVQKRVAEAPPAIVCGLGLVKSVARLGLLSVSAEGFTALAVVLPVLLIVMFTLMVSPTFTDVGPAWNVVMTRVGAA
jgi:hypothetical protein